MAWGVGQGGGLRGHGELPLSADINVTSLVDVAFVLLIIFMITAPIMQGGVEVELPKAEARPIAAKEGMVVSVNQGGAIFIDDTQITGVMPAKPPGMGGCLCVLVVPQHDVGAAMDDFADLTPWQQGAVIVHYCHVVDN